VTALNELSAVEAAAGLESGAFTAEALARACLERIAAREPVVGAWTYLDEKAVLERARALDRGPRQGAVFGLPVGIKDIVATWDMPTGYGSPIYTGSRPLADAPCVALLREAGAVVMGKTVTTEFAHQNPGKTANPHNPGHTPGGSSSGSAAAVADRMVPLAYGTQTGGSVIRPASFCGVVGYKAGHGQLPLEGVKTFSHTLDTLGVFARKVADVALVRAALLGAPGRVPALDGPPTVGICRTYDWERADPAMQAALEAAARALEAAGASVEEVDLPQAFAGLGDAQAAVMAHEGRRNFADERLRHADKLSPPLAAMLADGGRVDYARYAAALDLAQRCRAQLVEVCRDYDALLAPSAIGEAPKSLASTGDPLFNRVWTLLHVAAVNLPGHVGPAGLPLGLQAILPSGQDDRLLAVAQWMEERIA